MHSSEVMQKLEILVQGITSQIGCELYDLELTGVQGRRTLRIFIDKAPGGAGIDDCSQVSRKLSESLDVEDPIDGAYDLEVSTPGLDRPLRKAWHFSRVVGKKIWIKTAQPLSDFGVQNPKLMPMKQISEVLASADEQKIEFEIENEKVTIPLSALEKAKLVFELNPKGQKKGEKKKK